MALTNQKPFIAGNWKMYKTIPEALELVYTLREKCRGFEGAVIAVIPAFPALPEVRDILQGSSLELGAQNIFWEDQGAYTGEVSAPMLKEAGCRYVIVGHSERRQYFGETDETVNKKIKAALSHGLIPIFCLGESIEERKKGETPKKVEYQVAKGLEGIGQEDIEKVIIAYEPVWAIGTGLTATPEQAQEIQGFIRKKLAEKYSSQAASRAIILYGGSVKPENTFSLIKEKDINGALVGGASLKAESFAEIIKEALRAYEEKWRV